SVFRAQDSPLPPLGATNSQVDDDGRLVLTSDRAGDATVSALPNGRPRFSFRARTRVTTSDPSASYVVDAGLSADGRRVVDAAPAGVGVVWDVDSARQVTRLQGHGDIFRAPALDARGDRAATVGPDAVRIWDTGSGELLETLSVTAPGTVALDRGGDTVVVVNAAGASTWDAGTGDRLATLAGTGDVFRSVRFDPAGDRVAAVGADGNARVWDAHTGAIIRTGFGTASSQAIGKRYDAVFADFSADGRQLVTIASGGVLRVWDAESGRLLAEPPAVTVSNQLGVTLAALTRDRGHVVVALGTSISRYPCTVCATTPELVRRARTAVSRYVARHAQTLLEQ
ncbi:MAG TPA: hypothetical protein VEP49_13830, partial [Acidimicrobiia bacterium]|nr:hypothetical protein [Acidimicrobiia bacterium]